MKRSFFKALSGGLSVCLAAVLTTATAYAKQDWPTDTGIGAEAGIVIDADSGAVLYGQNIHMAYPPASIIKLLTALIVLEHCGLDETIEYSEQALLSVEAGSGDKLSLRAGDTLSVKDSLYGLLLVSVNQCANGLAEHAAGSIPAFVDMMNAKLTELGLSESHFDNPSGLNGDTQYVTAYDMAMIAKAAFENEDVLKISSTVSYKIGPTQLNPEGQSIQNEHRLIYTDQPDSPYYCPEAVAGKTGYLMAAGNTLVTYGERDGRHVISVILKGTTGTPRQYFIDGKNLLLFGLDRFENINISENETRYVTGTEQASINGSLYQPSALRIDPEGEITVPKGASFADAEMTLQEELPADAPVGAVGQLVYTYNGRQVGTAFLMTDGTSVQVGADEAGQTDKASSSDSGLSNDQPDSAQEGNGGLSSVLSSLKGFTGKIPFMPVLAGILAATVLAAAGGVVWTLRSRKKEAEELARRRERRRQRLSEEGLEQKEEFERLLEERRKRKS